MILSDTQKIILLGTFCTNSKCEKSCFFLFSENWFNIWYVHNNLSLPQQICYHLATFEYIYWYL